MAFIKVKEMNGVEKIINTDYILNISSAKFWNGDDVYTVLFENDTSSIYTQEEAQKIFQVIGVSLD